VILGVPREPTEGEHTLALDESALPELPSLRATAWIWSVSWPSGPLQQLIDTEAYVLPDDKVVIISSAPSWAIRTTGGSSPAAT
jgi:hypothetical protein